MFASPRVRFQLSVSSDGIVMEKGTKSMVITLVFRGKSDSDSFVGKFWEAWRGRAWEGAVSDSKDGDTGGTGRVLIGDGGGSSSGDTLALRMPVVGLSGILRKEQEMWENTDKSLQDAFQDLNALMVYIWFFVFIIIVIIVIAVV